MEEIRAAVEFNNVSYTAGDTAILKNITGCFPAGCITTVVGPSGAGKTTLFRLCNGLLPRDSGEITVRGKNIDQYNPVELRKTVGIALQSATMFPGSVRKNLELPWELQKSSLPEQAAKKMLTRVGLDETFLRSNVKDLSGGQRQKLSVARTLMNQPAILLLDEITSSLDPVSKQDMEALITSINREHQTTVIWITHNLEQATAMGDYTWAMIDGEVLETGESPFLNDPTDEQVKHFVKGVGE